METDNWIISVCLSLDNIFSPKYDRSKVQHCSLIKIFYLQIQVKWYTWESLVQIKQQISTGESPKLIGKCDNQVCFGTSSSRILGPRPKWVIWIWKRWAESEWCYCLLLTSISSFNLNYLAGSFIAVPPLPGYLNIYFCQNEFLFVFSGSLKHTSELLPKKAIWSNIRPDQTEHI